MIFAVAGLFLEILGAYYLSRGVFINEIRRVYYYGEPEFAKFPFGLKLVCWVLGINRQNIEDKVSEGTSPESFWRQLTPELRKIVFQPFYGFLLLLGGLAFQIIAAILSYSSRG